MSDPIDPGLGFPIEPHEQMVAHASDLDVAKAIAAIG